MSKKITPGYWTSSNKKNRSLRRTRNRKANKFNRGMSRPSFDVKKEDSVVSELTSTN